MEIKLQKGKKYVTRDGLVVNMHDNDEHCDLFKFWADDFYYTPDGRVYSDGTEDGRDIVSEFPIISMSSIPTALLEKMVDALDNAVYHAGSPIEWKRQAEETLTAYKEYMNDRA